MIPTPAQVVPLLAPLAEALPSAIHDAIEAADALQPVLADRDNHFWSHAARFYNKRSLLAAQGNGWKLVQGVPNTGIHIILCHVHRIRVLRSLGDGPPHPGSNKLRRAAWAQPPGQGQFFLSADNEFLAEDAGTTLPAMNLLIDWYQFEGQARTFLSLPKEPWEYQRSVRVHWRTPLLSPSGEEFGDMRFQPPPPGDDFGDLIRIDPGELEAG